MVHALQLHTARSEARYLVAPNGNHVRVGTLETHPVYKSNIAPVQAESLGGIVRRAFPVETLLQMWPASSCSRVRVDKRGVRSRPDRFSCGRKHCAIVQLHLWDPVPPWTGECVTTDSHTSRIVRVAHHIFASLLDRSRWMVAVESSPAHRAHGF